MANVAGCNAAGSNSTEKPQQYVALLTFSLALKPDSKLISYGDYYIPQTLTCKSTEQFMQYCKSGIATTDKVLTMINYITQLQLNKYPYT